MLSKIKSILRPIVYFVPNILHRRRRVKSLSDERVHYNAQAIERGLDDIPVPQSAVVLVHSSLKAIGYIEGGPQAVVQALVNSIVEKRGGTLLFPTYSINGTMHHTLVDRDAENDIVFDVANTRSNLGAIPEAFRIWPGVVRSVHPTHSFSALGPLAEQLTKSHHTCGSSFGKGSPMAEMIEHNGWLVGLGTNLGNVTMYHCLEEIENDFPLNVFTQDSPLSVNCKDWNGDVHRLKLNTHDSSVSKTRIDRPENEAIRDFFTKQFETHAELSWHQVCQARTWFVPAKKFYDESARLMRDGITIYTSKSELTEKGFR